MTLEETKQKYGLAAAIPIDDNTRHADCNAEEATLDEIDGNVAIYRGTCACRHVYEFRVQFKEANQAVHLENGELTLGGGKDNEARELGDY